MLKTALVGLLLVVAALGAAGCGNDDATTAQPPAQPYDKRSTAPDVVAHVVPADYRKPITSYKRFVAGQLDNMDGDVAELQAAVVAGRLPQAQAAWLKADARYETIGAAYGAFGALDSAINGRPAGLSKGVRSRDFTGLHRIELALWQRRSTSDAVAPTASLRADVAKLRSRVGAMTIDPLEYSLRAHEILEDGIHLQLSGQASPWSGSALVALQSEARGTRFVLTTLTPMIERRDSGGALPQAERALSRLTHVIRDLRNSDGTLPRWDRLDQRARGRVNAATEAAAEQLAYVPELIDPRPPRPAQRAFGDK